MDNHDTLIAIRTELEAIRKNAEAQTSLLSNASTYFIGFAIAFGMNLGAGKGLVGSALYALFSWINVGYSLGQWLPTQT